MNVFDLAARISLDSSGFTMALKAAGVAITAASTAIVAFGASSVKTGMEFDKSMSQVAATMGTTVDQIGDLREFAQEMGRTTAFSATQAADALNYMALAGYDANTSMKMLPNVLNLAAAGNIDLAKASDMVTDTQTAFGISLDRTTQMVDEMAKAASTGNTSVEQLGEAFLTVGGLAKELNGGMVTLADGTEKEVDGVQELEIALTAMANAGIKGSEAGTHMRNMLLKLSSPTSAGTKQLEALGVSVFDANGQMRSLNDILGDLSDSLGGLTQEQKIQAISDLFNTRDMAAAEALLASVEQDWDDIGASILDAQGAASKMAETQLDNLAGDITLFKSALDGAKITISDKLTPTLRKFVQTGTKSITKLTNAFAEKGLKGAFEALGEILPEIAQRIVSAIPKLIDAAVELIKGFIKALPGILQEIPNVVRSLVQGIVTLIREIDWLELIKGILEGVGGIIKGIFEGIVAGSSEANAAWYAQRDAIREAIIEYQNALEAAQNMNTERANTYEGLNAEVDLMEDIKSKLIEYTDEQGHVKEGYEDEMAALVTLAEAQGIHIELENGEIQGYSDLIDNIDEAIKKRKEEAITAAETEMYEEAYKTKRKLDNDYRTHYENYLDLISKADEARIEGRDADADKYMALANEEKEAVETLANAIVENSAQMELASHNMAAAAEGDFDSIATTYDQAGIDLDTFAQEVKDANSEITTDYEDTFKVRIPDAIKEGNHDAWYAMHIEAIGAKEQAKYDYAGVANYSIQGFEEAMYGGKSRVIDAAASVMRSAINAAKAEAQIKSPSKVWAWMGKMLDEGLVVGIGKEADNVMDAVEALHDEVNNAINGIGGTVDIGVDANSLGLEQYQKSVDTERILAEILRRMNYLEEMIYDGVSMALSDGFDLRWNDRELTRLVKEYA